ncbi:alpha/beta hydrolase family protein [Microbacterium sp. 2MCAF23]|uniref:alpha/beta hydrolase family protein n=1 Tax=Microbacterium sp. 2MCAF23 TaxID=3232985 RepID=UPI003F9CA5CE
MQLIDEARRLLAADDRVDPERIALMGVSWGGLLTCIASTVIPGFACAVSVYGCGYLSEASMWKRRGVFDSLESERVAAWNVTWDPSSHLAMGNIPLLFLTGVNDVAYPLVSVDRTAALSPLASRSILRHLPHSHGDAWRPTEPERFVNSVLRGTRPLPRIEAVIDHPGRAQARVDSDGAVQARLLYTTDVGAWEHRRWDETPASVARDVVAVAVPSAATAGSSTSPTTKGQPRVHSSCSAVPGE